MKSLKYFLLHFFVVVTVFILYFYLVNVFNNSIILVSEENITYFNSSNLTYSNSLSNSNEVQVSIKTSVFSSTYKPRWYYGGVIRESIDEYGMVSNFYILDKPKWKFPLQNYTYHYEKIHRNFFLIILAYIIVVFIYFWFMRDVRKSINFNNIEIPSFSN